MASILLLRCRTDGYPFFVNRFIYLSLPFFDKSEEECETGFEKLIYILKYMEMDEVSLDR